MTNAYKREYYTEAYRILLSYREELVSKIPRNLMTILENMALDDYNFNYNPNISFREQNVKKEAVALLTALKLQYFSTEEEKQQIKAKLNEASQRHEQERNEKYSYENLFKKPEEKVEKTEQDVTEIQADTNLTDLQVTKKNGIIRLIGRIKLFFVNIFKGGK